MAEEKKKTTDKSIDDLFTNDHGKMEKAVDEYHTFIQPKNLNKFERTFKSAHDEFYKSTSEALKKKFGDIDATKIKGNEDAIHEILSEGVFEEYLKKAHKAEYDKEKDAVGKLKGYAKWDHAANLANLYHTNDRGQQFQAFEKEILKALLDENEDATIADLVSKLGRGTDRRVQSNMNWLQQGELGRIVHGYRLHRAPMMDYVKASAKKKGYDISDHKLRQHDVGGLMLADMGIRKDYWTEQSNPDVYGLKKAKKEAYAVSDAQKN